MVERAAERPAELARMLDVVRDPGHDVAAAEALRILERGRRERLAAGEVNELEHDGGGPDVEGKAEQPAAGWPEVVDRGPVVGEEAHVTVDHPDCRINLERGAAGRHEDPEPSAQDGELDLDVLAHDDGSAREPVARPEECLFQPGGGQGLAARGHLDDAFGGDAVTGMDEVRRHPRSIGAGWWYRGAVIAHRQATCGPLPGGMARLDALLRQRILTVHGDEPTCP